MISVSILLYIRTAYDNISSLKISIGFSVKKITVREIKELLIKTIDKESDDEEKFSTSISSSIFKTSNSV